MESGTLSPHLHSDQCCVREKLFPVMQSGVELGVKALAPVGQLTLFQLMSDAMHYWDHTGEAGAKPKVIRA